MASNDKDEYTIFKYIIIGEMGVGKSALLAQFTEQKCTLSHLKEFEED